MDGKLEDYINQNVKDYMYVATTGMCNDGVWATDAEIMATANLLGVDMIIYGKAKRYSGLPSPPASVCHLPPHMLTTWSILETASMLFWEYY